MLKFSGTGSAFNTKLGNTSAYIKNENKLLMIDCGSSTFSTIKNAGLLDDVNDVMVLITHTHADHVGSLADLIFYMYYTKDKFKPRVSIYSPYDMDIDYLLSLNGVTKDKYYLNLLINKVHYTIPSMKLFISPYPTEHVNELKNVMYLISNYESELFSIYTGDTNKLPEEINKLLNEIDYLYVDTCSQDYDGNVHLSIKKLDELLNNENRHKVYCMHLDEQFDVEKAKSLGFNVAEVEL